MPEAGSETRVMQIAPGAPEARPELNISLEKVCFVIAKARELDVKVAPEELDDASDEDMMQRILEDYADDPTFEELRSFLVDQNDDELKELLALDVARPGRLRDRGVAGRARAGCATCASTTRPTICSGTPLAGRLPRRRPRRSSVSPAKQFELGRM